MYLLLKLVLKLYFGIFLCSTIIKIRNVSCDQIIEVIDSEEKIIQTSEQWKTLIGSNVTPETFTFVNVHGREDNRSENKSDDVTVHVNVTKLRKHFKLKLVPNDNITDPHFIALARKINHSKPIEEKIVNFKCFYQSLRPSAALDICDGLRGILAIDQNHVLFIHPLTAYHTNDEWLPHVLIEKQLIPNGSYTDTILTDDKISHKFLRRKRDMYSHQRAKMTNESFECGNTIKKRMTNFLTDEKRLRRDTTSSAQPTITFNKEIFVETAVFVDKDMYNHMTAIYPKNTEKELIRFVLALINAVHLLYHDPSLGWVINFVLKRLEILHTDPPGLNRAHDIDKYLSSFCMWQHTENPTNDEDPLHWDHAVILTGLDLYVLSKNGKASNQVVGLAPVAGMCTATSSCTINEGRHFESAYVVAHEIGHNLGMRHDGPSAENTCDPSGFLMSPTLGSGKITWSTCSKQYLQTFLQSKQSRCLYDKSTTSPLLDHSANNFLPGEIFDVVQQCKLKYGSDSFHSPSQPLEEICTDLQCSRSNFIWTSHPALEGSVCGSNKWCRSGRCIEKGLTVIEAGYVPHQVVNGGWSGWSPYSECASSCLYSDNGTLTGGSIGITIASRRCNNPRPENGGQICAGNYQKYKTCTAYQCQKVAKITIKEFSNDICKRASEVDIELTGTGQQRMNSDSEDACKIWCIKKKSDFKSSGFSYPDGTVCHLKRRNKSTYCIRGVCKVFTCAKNSSDIIYAHSEQFCNQSNLLRDKKRESLSSQWVPISECFYNCITPGTGMRLIEKRPCHGCNTNGMNVQICQHSQKCHSLKSITEHAAMICNKFSQKVRQLSGFGVQLASTSDDPHRSCRLACQDEKVNRRFYLVNGEEGWFPFGTDCARGDVNRKAFCVNGKCLEFSSENESTPIHFPDNLLTSGRIKRQTFMGSKLKPLHYNIIAETLGNEFSLKSVHRSVHRLGSEYTVSINFQNPINLETSD